MLKKENEKTKSKRFACVYIMLFDFFSLYIIIIILYMIQ
jgi:hypothetical protein